MRVPRRKKEEGNKKKEKERDLYCCVFCSTAGDKEGIYDLS